MITATLTVKRDARTVYSNDHPRGSGYCEDHIDRQYLIKEWRLFGLRIWYRVMDEEEVPSFASIQNAVFGQTEWKSKFAEYI